MALSKDYYKSLGIPKDASQQDIKKAYFQLAKKYHPDMNKNDPNAAKKFQEVTEAYEVLGDPSKRQMYDTYGATSDQQQQGFSGDPFEGFQGFGGFGGQGSSPFEEIFRQAFGGSRGDPFESLFRNRPGTNVAMGVQISLFEAAFGCKKEVTYRYDDGRGRKRGTRTVSVDIPAGIDNEMELRLEGQGLNDSNGRPGNLFIQVEVQEDPFFKRQGSDVHVSVPISLTKLIVGCKLDVLTLDGMVELEVKPGTSPDAKLVLRGKGIVQIQSNARGNQYVHLDVQMPKSLSSRQRQLIEEFEREENQKSSNNFWNFKQTVENTLNRLKKFWNK